MVSGKVSGKTKALLVLPLALIGVAGWLGWAHMTRSEAFVLSQDATVGAAVTDISASVPGRIGRILVAENDKVEKGQVLFELEDETYRLMVAQAEAELKGAQAAYAAQTRNIAAESANARIADQQVERARANLELAEETLARLLPLQPKGYVTDQQVQDARTAKRDAEVSLRQALQQNEAADALVSTTDAAAAAVAAAQATLSIAQRNLANTKVVAPHDGRVVGLRVSSGQYVLTGVPVFTLVNTEHWHATALYREADLKGIGIGDCAKVYIMADPKTPVRGRVQGIGWGVASQESLNLPLNLPYVPKELDWVRIAQRFPVRVDLIDPPERLMRMGASASTVIDDGVSC